MKKKVKKILIFLIGSLVALIIGFFGYAYIGTNRRQEEVYGVPTGYEYDEVSFFNKRLLQFESTKTRATTVRTVFSIVDSMNRVHEDRKINVYLIALDGDRKTIDMEKMDNDSIKNLISSKNAYSIEFGYSEDGYINEVIIKAIEN